MLSQALACVVAAVCVHAIAADSDTPWSALIKSSSAVNDLPDFCNKLDCPAYTVVNKTQDYEERQYVASQWVTTHEEGVDYATASRIMFMKLYDYIDRHNTKQMEIKMTNPVLVQVQAGPGPACKSNFTQSFFMSPSLKDPPKPTDKTVFFSSLPSQRVFVRAFGDFASEPQWVQNAAALAKSLSRDNKQFVESFFFTAEYDSPFKVLNRHNEVWLIAK